jgi:hypothetical protein
MPINPDCMRKAISVMTAWQEHKPDAPHDENLMMRLLTEYVDEGTESQAQLTMGLLGVASYLLIMLEAKGQPMSESLQEIANYFAA